MFLHLDQHQVSLVVHVTSLDVVFVGLFFVTDCVVNLSLCRIFVCVL